MPVFDFNEAPEVKAIADRTYDIYYSDAHVSDPEHPMLVLDA